MKTLDNFIVESKVKTLDTRGAITHVLELHGFGGVQVPQAEYGDAETFTLKLTTTPSEASSIGKGLEKINKRFTDVEVTNGKDKTIIALPLKK